MRKASLSRVAEIRCIQLTRYMNGFPPGGSSRQMVDLQIPLNATPSLPGMISASGTLSPQFMQGGPSSIQSEMSAISATPGLDRLPAALIRAYGGVGRQPLLQARQYARTNGVLLPIEPSNLPRSAGLRVHFHFQPWGSHRCLSRLSDEAPLNIILGLLTQLTPPSKGRRPRVRTSGAACTDRRRVGAKRIGSGTTRF